MQIFCDECVRKIICNILILFRPRCQFEAPQALHSMIISCWTVYAQRSLLLAVCEDYVPKWCHQV